MKYSEYDIKRLKEAANIADFIPDVKQIGRKSYATCPNCGKSGKDGMLVTHNSRMDLAKCFSCGFSLNGAISAVMHYDNCEFLEAAEKVAQQCGFPLEPNDVKVKKAIRKTEQKISDSFCFSQLKASGLTLEDVTAKLPLASGDGFEYVQTFRKGGMDSAGNPNFNDDEMLIFYYDLYGQPMKFATRGAAGALKNYVRVRWSNPDIHINPKDGKAIKYQTPKGADARFYIPQRIRDAFASGEHIETLIIQEGEKKAEKACKHGILSIGIQGIYNIGNKDGGLIQDLQYLAKKCSIKNIVLLFDSDWDDLSKNIEPKDDIDMRPKQFAKAAVKFRKYVETLHNVGTYVDVWCAHINANERGDKGIDDLLCGTLKDREPELLEDITKAMKSHDGKGEFCDFFKISTLTDMQIMDIWNLRDREKFFEIHADRLKDLSVFKFGSVTYLRSESGEITKATTSGSDAEFWVVEYSENAKGLPKKEVKFDSLEALSWLESNGFARYESPELEVSECGFMKISNNIAKIIGDWRIRDFVYEYAVQNCKDRDVINYLIERLGSLMGKDRLERLAITDMSEFYEADVQNRYYKNGQLRITAGSIEFGPMLKTVWEENVIKRSFKRIPVIKEIVRNDSGTFKISFTEDGNKCQFLQYLQHTSFFWKDKEKEMSLKDWDDYNLHVVNKLTAMGYLLTDYKYPTESVAVVAMDAKMSEVGQSHGRTGKSLVGVAIGHILSRAIIDGKNLKPDDDYMYSTVTPRTRNITIDDVKARFSFAKIFQALTSDLQVNPKGKARFSIDFEKAPKFYINTNHTIEEDSPSAKDRMLLMSFSDWYSTDYTPIMEFGNAFFTQWDEYQWQLFDNLMAECVMYYFRSMQLGWTKPGRGAVPPPVQDLHARELRQKIGETFLQWADAYFDASNSALDNRIDRKVMFDEFCKEYPGSQRWVTASNFSTKLKSYCELRGLHLNPHKKRADAPQISFSDWKSRGMSGVFIGDRDCSGGREYYTVATSEFAAASSL